MAGSANIDSPEVLRDFKRAVVEFLELADQAMNQDLRDANRVLEWLRHERQGECKRRAHRLEELASEARIRYLAAKGLGDLDRLRKPSLEEEERDMRRTRAAFEAAEEQLKRIRKALVELPRAVDQPVGLIRRRRDQVDELGTALIARLDRMADELEDYFRAGGGG